MTAGHPLRRRTLRQCLPPFVREAEDFRDICAYLTLPRSILRDASCYIEASFTGPPSVGLTPLFILRTRSKRRALLSVLGKLEAAITGRRGRAERGFWRGYLANLSRLPIDDPLMPLNVIPAIETLAADPGAWRIDFAIATYEPMNAVRDRARLLACFRLFETPDFAPSLSALSSALDRCGRLDIRHIGAGTRDGKTVIKCYAEGSLRRMLGRLAPGTAAPLRSAAGGVLDELASRLGERIVAQAALDFVGGRLVRLGVELEAPQVRRLGAAQRRALLGARAVSGMPKPVRGLVAALFRYRARTAFIGERRFHCSLQHLKVSFDLAGRIQWKAYFLVLPL